MLVRLRHLGLLVPLLTVIFLLAGVSDTEAKRKKKRGKRKTVAVFPFIERDDPDREVSDAVYGLLSKASVLIKNVTVVTGNKLKKKLRKDPSKLVAACGSNLKCLSKLGKKARANEALIAMVSPDDNGGVKVSFLVIDSKRKKIARKKSLVFAATSDVKAVLGGAFYELFGVTDPGFLKIDGADSRATVMVAGKAVGKGPGPHRVLPGRHEVVVGDFTETVMIMPDKTKTIAAVVAPAKPAPEAPPPEPPGPPPMVASAETQSEAAAPVLALEPPPPVPAAPSTTETRADPNVLDLGVTTASSESEVAASSMATSEPASATAGTKDETLMAALDAAGEPKLELPPPPPPAQRGISPGILTWVGAGVGGAGLILAGVGGGVTGSEAVSLNGSISAETHTQLGALEQQNQAQGMATTSTALFISGGAVAAVGLVLAILDLFVFEVEPSVQVSQGEARVSATGFTF